MPKRKKMPSKSKASDEALAIKTAKVVEGLAEPPHTVDGTYRIVAPKRYSRSDANDNPEVYGQGDELKLTAEMANRNFKPGELVFVG